MKAEDITYTFLNELAAETGYTDHIPHFRKLFSLMKVRHFLECGCGYSTKYFLENCEKVTSIEFTNPGFGEEWMVECQKMYKEVKNWRSVICYDNGNIYKASSYQPAEKKDYALVDPAYVKELRTILQFYLPAEVAFVDCGIYLRGDMVELLLQEGVPVVVAHDCAMGEEYSSNLYGWHKIKSVKNYEFIQLQGGQTTCFWIDKKLSEVIKGMKMSEL